MDILLNPNIAYILLVLGSVLLLMAIVTPGTHLLEGGAFIMLVLAGYAIYHLGFNLWAMIVLVLSLVPFVYAIQKPKRELILALSLLGVIIGSVYLFPSSGWLPAVNPVVAVVVSALSAGFLWLVVRKGIQAHHARPLQDLSTLIGKTGEAKTQVRGRRFGAGGRGIVERPQRETHPGGQPRTCHQPRRIRPGRRHTTTRSKK